MSSKRLLLCLLSVSLLFTSSVAISSYTPISQEEIHNDALITQVLDFGTQYICEKASTKYSISCSDVEITQVVSVSKQELNTKTNFNCSVMVTNNDGATLNGTFTVQYNEKTQNKIVSVWQYHVNYDPNANSPANYSVPSNNEILQYGTQYICEKAATKYGITCNDLEITKVVSISKQEVNARTNFSCSVLATNNDGATLNGTFIVEFNEKTGEKIVRVWQYNVNYKTQQEYDIPSNTEILQFGTQYICEKASEKYNISCDNLEITKVVSISKQEVKTKTNFSCHVMATNNDGATLNGTFIVEFNEKTGDKIVRVWQYYVNYKTNNTQPVTEEEDCIVTEANVEVEVTQPEENCADPEVEVEVPPPETEDCTNTEVVIPVEEDCTNTEVDVEVEVPEAEEDCISVEVEVIQPEEDCTHNTEVDVEVPQPETEDCTNTEVVIPVEEDCSNTEVDVEVEVPQVEEDCTNVEVEVPPVEDCNNTEVDVEVPQVEENCVEVEVSQPETEDCTNTEVNVEIEIPLVEEDCTSVEVPQPETEDCTEVEVPTVEEDCSVTEADVEVSQPETEEDCTTKKP